MIKKIFGIYGIIALLLMLPVISAQIDIISPISQTYNSRSILLHFNSDIKGNFYLTRSPQSTDGIVLCKNALTCKKIIKASEGENHFWIKRISDGDIQFSDELDFLVDSISPKLFRTNFAYDTRGYANGKGIFISYSENNLENVELYYGPEGATGAAVKTIDESDCSSGERQTCNFPEVDLSEFEGSKIELWVKLYDSVGNSAVSKKQRVTVDTISPVITSTDYTVRGSRVSFSIGVTEKNLKEIRYRDTADCYSSGYREGVLCTKLNKNGNCLSDRNLCSGWHKIEVVAKDFAGNEDEYSFEDIKIDD